MTLPPSRNGGTLERAADCLYGECMWFSQPANIPGEPTLNDEALRTYNVEVSAGPRDFTRHFPWRAPGSAPVIGTGCGRAGGGPERWYNGGTAKEFGLVQDMDGSELAVVNRTVWQSGGIEEVAWAVNANHGGGYSYRLCRSGEALTEACFQRTPLRFAGDKQWLQWRQSWGDNESSITRAEIPRVTVSSGTHPVGSEWARVTIPACKICPTSLDWSSCPAGADCAGCCDTVPLPAHPRINESWWRTQDCLAMSAGSGLPGSCPQGQMQFPEPLPGMSATYSSWLWCDAPPKAKPAHIHPSLGDSPHDEPCRNNAAIKMNIVDHIQVPDLEAGDYVLSWRWDSEATNQIWQNCGDVTIEDALV